MAILPLIFVTASGFGQFSNEPSAKRADDPIHICESNTHRTYVLPVSGDEPRAVLGSPGGQKIVVEPAIKVNADDLLAARYDYRIVIEPLGRRYRIASFGRNADDSEDLAYRRLESVGISCTSANDAWLYFSFEVNGSMRDFFYVGMRMNGAGEPMPLGHASYGVLALDRKDPFAFSIWDSSAPTAVNAMGAIHDYKVFKYRWRPDEKSVELMNQRDAKPAYPSQVMGQIGRGGIRVGGPGPPVPLEAYRHESSDTERHEHRYR
ncbi:MAG TPA: hypothetical protein VKZ53_27510 [Candidatus Angelobacter sp.]|nr:hypothetical protein [Candidatus Angelobacter sp.]